MSVLDWTHVEPWADHVRCPHWTPLEEVEGDASPLGGEAVMTVSVVDLRPWNSVHGTQIGRAGRCKDCGRVWATNQAVVPYAFLPDGVTEIGLPR